MCSYLISTSTPWVTLEKTQRNLTLVFKRLGEARGDPRGTGDPQDWVVRLQQLHMTKLVS